jgi:hypothetical protein
MFCFRMFKLFLTGLLAWYATSETMAQYVWTNHQHPLQNGVNSIVWTGNQLVMVGGISSGDIATSPDGINWTDRSIGSRIGPGNDTDDIAVNSLTDVVWADNQLIAVGNGGHLLQNIAVLLFLLLRTASIGPCATLCGLICH